LVPRAGRKAVRARLLANWPDFRYWGMATMQLVDPSSNFAKGRAHTGYPELATNRRSLLSAFQRFQFFPPLPRFPVSRSPPSRVLPSHVLRLAFSPISRSSVSRLTSHVLRLAFSPVSRSSVSRLPSHVLRLAFSPVSRSSALFPLPLSLPHPPAARNLTTMRSSS
jgi:hypothetical protein